MKPPHLSYPHTHTHIYGVWNTAYIYASIFVHVFLHSAHGTVLWANKHAFFFRKRVQTVRILRTLSNPSCNHANQQQKKWCVYCARCHGAAGPLRMVHLHTAATEGHYKTHSTNIFRNKARCRRRSFESSICTNVSANFTLDFSLMWCWTSLQNGERRKEALALLFIGA